MSFFKDFKEDLSQAVNELMPEETVSQQSSDFSIDDIMASLNEEPKNDSEDIAMLLNDTQPDQAPADPFGGIPAFNGETVTPEPVNADMLQNGMEAEAAAAAAQTPSPQPVFDTIPDPVPVSVIPTPEEPVMAAPSASPDISSMASMGAAPVMPAETEPTPVQTVQAQPAPAYRDIPQASAMQQPSFAEPEPMVQTVQQRPVQPQPAERTQPVQRQQPHYAKEPSRPAVEPVFKDNTYRSAPINTTGVRTTKETGVIIEGMSVTGDIISEGNLEIMGSIKGNIKLDGKLKITGSIEGNSDVEEVFADKAKITGDIRAGGTVKIGQGTVVKGNINATSGVIAGAVKGDIDIVGPVILDSTAIIMGNIKSRTLQINNGAVIEGLCSQCYAEVNPMSFFEKE